TCARLRVRLAPWVRGGGVVPARRVNQEGKPVKVAIFGRRGRVGSVLAPALDAAGHTIVEPDEAEAALDFTRPDAVVANVLACIERGVPCVIGTTGADLDPVDAA